MGVIVGATVTATNLATGQERSVTTDASGTYKFSLLAAGNYAIKFSASGFKTSQVPSVTVSITETPVLNQKLEVGAQTEQVTVESTAETIQTQNATVGALVGAKEVTDLPLSSRNYTQIIDLSPGVVANVSSAAAVGNGTQDINVNGMGIGPEQLHDGRRDRDELRQRRRRAVWQLPRYRHSQPGFDSGIQDSDFAVRR